MASSTRVIAILSMLLLSAIGSALGKDDIAIRFGTIPVLQALPIFVAQDKGFFEKAGVKVEIVPFSTAAEKDIALSTGGIDGYFGDLLTPIVLRGNGREVFITATNYDTRKDRRTFAILGKPGAKYKSAADLAGVPVAVSSNSVIDHVTERLLTSAGVPKAQQAAVESKNIGLRMQMLLSGQVEAATLPEPLVTAAVAKGAVLLADDAGLETSQTVLVFSGPFMKAHGAAVKSFLRAIDAASRYINDKPDEVRSVMVEHVRLPDPLKAAYPVPRFPELHPPDEKAVKTIVDWLVARGVIKDRLGYEQVVDASLIK